MAEDTPPARPRVRVYRLTGAQRKVIRHTCVRDVFRVSWEEDDTSMAVLTWHRRDVDRDGRIAGIPDVHVEFLERKAKNNTGIPTPAPPKTLKGYCTFQLELPPHEKLCGKPFTDGQRHRQYCPPGVGGCYNIRMARKQRLRRAKEAAKRAAALQLAHDPSPYPAGDG